MPALDRVLAAILEATAARQRAQIRHAGADGDVVGAGRQRQREAEVQLDPLGIDQARAHAGTVGAQHLAAIDHHRQHQRTRGTVFGAGIGWSGGGAAEQAHLPQRQLGVRRRRQLLGGCRRRERHQRHHGRHRQRRQR